jgi:hypothetical protein
MDRQELQHQLEELLNEFEKRQQYGYIQIDFVSGRPDLIRKMTTQKISNGGNSQHEQHKQR